MNKENNACNDDEVNEGQDDDKDQVFYELSG